MNYIWMKDPDDSRDSRITWDHENSPYAPPRGYVSRPAIMRDHNCSRCDSGRKACVEGGHGRCSWLHARND